MRALRLACVVFLAAAAAGRAAESGAAAAKDVKDAETAFAKAFADRDQAKFFAFVAEDANFLSPNRTLAGKAQVVETWSRFFKDSTAPFSWRPERVVVNGAGDIGLSMGPVLDPGGKHIGNFSSVWQKQKDGAWKVVFDGPGSPVCPPEAEKK
jgi:ketosteroid isomerase-like protein